MGWKMFLIERTPFARRSMRRFENTSGPYVAKAHTHDKTVVIDDQIPCPGDTNGRCLNPAWPFDVDARWPTKCDCGYVFLPTDYKQLCEERLWKGSPDGKLYLLRGHPPGATWICDWFGDETPNGQWSGPDGKVWAVMLPSGMEWLIYSYSSDDGPDGKRIQGPKWTVDGTPPNVTVSPSINSKGYYHGFVKQGIISADCEGRQFPQWPATA